MSPVVAIGASQGGVKAIHALVSGLPADFPAPILIVVHIGAGPSILPSILTNAGTLPASHARTGERMEPGHIYIAPPDQHLLLGDGLLELSHGPRENWARPAIDPLFRTAAEAFGESAIGVILTGGLNDGTAGLYEIKRRGGIAIVQDPQDAECPSMPRSALKNVDTDFCVPLSKMPELLVRLTKDLDKRERGRKEPGVHVMKHPEERMQRPVAQTCPDCGGALRQEQLGSLTRFRCHIGHVMTAEVFAAAQLELLERDLSVVLRSLNERADFCNEMVRKHASAGDTGQKALWQQASDEARNREEALRAMTHAEWIRPEAIEQAAE